MLHGEGEIQTVRHSAKRGGSCLLFRVHWPFHKDGCCETVVGGEHHREESLSSALLNVNLSLVTYTEGKTMGALSCKAINSYDSISMASRAQCLDPSSEGYLGAGDKPRKAGMGALGEKNQKPSPGPSPVEHSSWPETG